MPLRRRVLSLQELTMHSIGHHVAELVPVVSEQIETSEKAGAVDTGLLHRLRLLHEHMSSHINVYLQPYIAVMILDALSKVLERPNVGRPHPKVLAEMVLVHHIKKLNYPSWPQDIREVLSSILPNLNAVSCINFNYPTCQLSCFRSHAMYDHQVDSIVNNVAQLTELRAFCLLYFSDDLLVETVIRNCKKIICLSVSFSPGVTSRCVPSLMSCTNLNELYIGHTHISMASRAALAANLPNLVIFDIGKCHDYNLVFQHFNGIGPFPNLRKLIASDLYSNTLDVLINVFPNIDSITITNFLGDLMVLSCAQNLSDLMMMSCICHNDSLTTFLDYKGRDMRSITWNDVDIDLEVWVNLSTSCPNLRELKYHLGRNTPSKTFTLSYQRRMESMPRFLHLRKLVWRAEDRFVLMSLLKLAVNIKYLNIDMAPVKTEDMYEVFNFNPMRKLEIFLILNCRHLTMEFVYFIMNSCKRIKVIAELSSWVNITDAGLETFKQYVKMNNYDLEVTRYYPY